MGKRKQIIGQDKDINGPLSKTTVSNVISKFMKYYENHQGDNICGFELNGGERMTPGAEKEWDAFGDWCKGKGMDAEYNSNPDLSTIHNSLRSIVKSIVKNRNK